VSEGVGVGEYEFIIMHFALPFLQAACFLQASGMMKSLTSFDFHLSLDKTWALLSAGLRKMDNNKLIFAIYMLERGAKGKGKVKEKCRVK